MTQKQATQDILTALGDSTYVVNDTEQHLQLEIPNHPGVTGDTLERIKMLFCNNRAVSVNCSIDFENSAIHLTTTATTFADRINQSSVNLNAITESERELCEIAQNMGTIDYDDLVPQLKLGNNDNYTYIEISDLLHVSHNAVVYYLEDYQNVVVKYDMRCKCVYLLLPKKTKRKR